MQPKSQLEKLREKLRNAVPKGKIVYINSNRFAHKHGKVTILHLFNERIGETEFACDCGKIFVRE